MINGSIGFIYIFPCVENPHPAGEDMSANGQPIFLFKLLIK